MKQLTEFDTKKLLERNGISIPHGELIYNENELYTIPLNFSGNIAMKICSPEIIHKSDAGGVVLNVNPRDVSQVYHTLISNAGKVKIDGVLIEEMISGYELIVGTKIDPQFGQVIMVGFGGIYAEVYKDVSFQIAPVTQKEAFEMLQELKGYPILTGIRGKEKANLEAIVDVIVKVSNLKNVIELDINPLIVNSTSAIAADARMIIDT